MIPTPAGEYKIVLVGDSAVGKSSLLCRFVDGYYDEKLLSTIGVDFKFRKVKVGTDEIKLQIWDTAGQYTFRAIVSAYYNNADGIILCYDVTSYESYESLKYYWLVEAYNQNKYGAKIFVVGTKVDLIEKRIVETYTLDSLKEKHHIAEFYEVSAKNNINVEYCFIDIARQIHLVMSAKKSNTKTGYHKVNLPGNTLSGGDKMTVQLQNRRLPACCIK